MANDEVDPVWDDAPDPSWSDGVLEQAGGWKSEPLRLVLCGPCPRCGHAGAIDAWVPQEAMTAAEGLVFDGDPPPKEQYVECACHFTHKQTPKDERGCGARGRVAVR